MVSYLSLLQHPISFTVFVSNWTLNKVRIASNWYETLANGTMKVNPIVEKAHTMPPR
jgi:hypothetical protein